MKQRPIKPSFWRDPVVAQWPDALRLFYIGTWMLADDSGIMQWDPAAIGADLYPFLPVGKREKLVIAHATALSAQGKLVHMSCGRHSVIPSVPEHPMGGRPTDQFEREHQHRCVTSGK